MSLSGIKEMERSHHRYWLEKEEEEEVSHIIPRVTGLFFFFKGIRYIKATRNNKTSKKKKTHKIITEPPNRAGNDSDYVRITIKGIEKLGNPMSRLDKTIYEEFKKRKEGLSKTLVNLKMPKIIGHKASL